MVENSELITLPRAAKVLGVSRRRVVGLIAEGKLWARSIPGAMTKLRRADVEAFAERYTKIPSEVGCE